MQTQDISSPGPTWHQRTLKWMLLGVLALVASVAIAQENCGYPTSLIKSGFETGEQPAQVSISGPSTPLTLSVTFPAEGSVIEGSSVQVYGTYSGPANTGIAIKQGTNALTLAQSNSTQYTTQPIALAAGLQTITIVASTLDGATQIVTRNITMAPAISPEVSFVSSTALGYAPMRASFSLRTRFPAGQNAVARVQVDYNADGTFDVDSVSATLPLAYYYTDAGAYLALARVSFDDGNAVTPLVVREASYQVQTTTLAHVRQTLCGVYYTMKSRLIANQTTLAANALDTSIRPTFQTLWTSLGAGLPTVAARLGEVVLGNISDVSAELTVAIPDPATAGEFLGFSVVWSKGVDGVWRIYRM
jgi:hypothetical protein